MSDVHIRILRRVARQRRLELEDHDAADHTGETEAARRWQRLAQSATRTTERVTEAEARRRYLRSNHAS